MLATTLLGALLVGPAAQAAGNEISFELGSFGAHDPNWELFSNDEQLVTWGFRGGYAITPNLAVIATWQHGAWGGGLDIYGESSYYDDDDEYYYEDTSLNLAFTANQFGVGPKYDVELFSWLRPYATAQFIAFLGTVRMDEDEDHDDNINQYKTSGFSPAGMAALGIDFIPVRPRRTGSLATYLEMGYGYAAPMKLGDLGQLSFNGFALRWGVGARF